MVGRFMRDGNLLLENIQGRGKVESEMDRDDAP